LKRKAINLQGQRALPAKLIVLIAPRDHGALVLAMRFIKSPSLPSHVNANEYAPTPLPLPWNVVNSGADLSHEEISRELAVFQGWSQAASHKAGHVNHKF